MKNYKNSFIFNFNFYEGGIALCAIFFFSIKLFTEADIILNINMVDVNNLFSFIFKLFEMGIENFCDANSKFYEKISMVAFCNAIPLIIDIIYILKVKRGSKKEKLFNTVKWMILCFLLLGLSISDLWFPSLSFLFTVEEFIISISEILFCNETPKNPYSKIKKRGDSYNEDCCPNLLDGTRSFSCKTINVSKKRKRQRCCRKPFVKNRGFSSFLYFCNFFHPYLIRKNSYLKGEFKYG